MLNVYQSLPRTVGGNIDITVNIVRGSRNTARFQRRSMRDVEGWTWFYVNQAATMAQN